MALTEITVDPRAEGERIDACLRRFMPQVPPAVVQTAFRRRDVKLNGVRVRQDARVHAGDRVQVYCMEHELGSLDIVYEDDDVLLVNKRSGISVEPDERGGVTLTELCQRHVAGHGFAHACHRLDNQTCGLVVFAKNAAAEEVLAYAFRERTLDKRYICLVRGMMKPPAAVCSAWLSKDAKAGRVAIHDHEVPGALPITTEYTTLEAGPVSRLEVHLITGRTHQIRAHLAALGHPLLGDDVYGDYAFNRAYHTPTLRLCACQLTLETGGRLPGLDGKTFRVKCPF